MYQQTTKQQLNYYSNEEGFGEFVLRGSTYLFENGGTIGANFPVVSYPPQDQAELYKRRKWFFQTKLEMAEAAYKKKRKLVETALQHVANGVEIFFDTQTEKRELKQLKETLESARQKFLDFTAPEREQADREYEQAQERMRVQQERAAELERELREALAD